MKIPQSAKYTILYSADYGCFRLFAADLRAPSLAGDVPHGARLGLVEGDGQAVGGQLRACQGDNGVGVLVLEAIGGLGVEELQPGCEIGIGAGLLAESYHHTLVGGGVVIGKRGPALGVGLAVPRGEHVEILDD